MSSRVFAEMSDIVEKLQISEARLLQVLRIIGKWHDNFPNYEWVFILPNNMNEWANIHEQLSLLNIDMSMRIGQFAVCFKYKEDVVKLALAGYSFIDMNNLVKIVDKLLIDANHESV